MSDDRIRGYKGNTNLVGKKDQMQFSDHEIRELMKCQEDIFHFVKYCTIVHVDKGKIPFHPYEFQERFIEKTANNRFVAALYPRQQGKTTTVAAVLLWYALFKEDQNIMVMANRLKGARNVLRRIQIMYEGLPTWMKVPVQEWAKTSIEFTNGSMISADATSGDSGRGESVSILYLDEFSMVNRNIQKEFMESVYPTITSGENTKVFITTTPKGFDLFYRIWQNSKAGKNQYVREIATWDEVPGRDENWKNNMIEQLGSERAFRQEFGIEFLGNSDTLIDPDCLTSIEPKDPIWSKNNGLRVYENPQEDHEYMVTVDVGEGVGGDYSALSVTDISVKPFKQVAVLQNNTIIPPVFPEVIYSIAKLYHDAYVLIELNGPGYEVARDLTEELEYENVLWTYNNGPKGQILTAGMGGKNLRPGVKTTITTKKKGVINLKGIMENSQYEIYDEETLDELMNFVQQKNSYAADDGHHDDIVMSMVLFAWASTQPFFSELSKSNVRSMMVQRRQEEIQDTTPQPMGFVPQTHEDGMYGDRLWLEDDDTFDDWDHEDPTRYDWSFDSTGNLVPKQRPPSKTRLT